MTKPLLLPVALAALLLALPEAPAQAQGVSNAPANTRAARRAREQAKAPAAEAGHSAPRFPAFSHPRSIEPPPEIVRYGARFGGDEQQDREAAE